jgi:hypothetical protein
MNKRGSCNAGNACQEDTIVIILNGGVVTVMLTYKLHLPSVLLRPYVLLPLLFLLLRAPMITFGVTTMILTYKLLSVHRWRINLLLLLLLFLLLLLLLLFLLPVQLFLAHVLCASRKLMMIC